MKSKLVLPPPIGICARCCKKPELTYEGETAIAIFCPHNLSGAIMQKEDGELVERWTIYTTVNRRAFDALIADYEDEADEQESPDNLH